MEEYSGKKTEACGNCGKSCMRGIVKLILGLVVITLGMLLTILWWEDLLVVARGGLGLLLFLTGVITIALAKR